MMCAGCSANVERKLASLTGVKEVAVNLPGRSAMIEYDDSVISPEKMKEELVNIGYDMVVDEDTNVAELEKASWRALLKKTIVSWVFAILVMAISMGWLHIGDKNTANQTMLIIALCNLIYCGRDIYKSAIRQLLHGSANMDTLVALSTAVSFLFSVFNTFWGDSFWGARGIENHTYFDASVMIITFVLTGRLLEEKAKNNTSAAIRRLMTLTPKTAHLADNDGNITEVPVSALGPGDVIEVRPGESIPVDGKLIKALDGDTAYIDESMISGEPLPVGKQTGGKVLAGTICKQGRFTFRAQATGKDTLLAGIIKMVQEAQGSKPPIQKLVDKVALYFVPAVTGIAILTFLLWWLIGGSSQLPRAILSAVSVLVIACPCAMGLATPTAIMTGIGRASQDGILIKDATALELLRRVDTLVTDKTGTITIPNKNADFTKSDNLSLEERETLKPNARETVEALRNSGVNVIMTSGDKEEAVKYWAEKAGISEYRYGVMPQDKDDLVKQLQTDGHVVAMAGDGINDSQALARADVSIAMGKGTDIAMDVAQLTLMSDDLRKIPEAINLSRRTVKTIRQNLFFSFIYNVCCIPLAAGVAAPFFNFQITPSVASALMAMSSVSVVLNSLRLASKKG